MKTMKVQAEHGEYRVYHREDAGCPDAHDDPGGPWYYEPVGYDGGEVWSRGYPTMGAARDAALDEGAQQAFERETR